MLNSSFADDERDGEFTHAHGRFGNGEDRFDGALTPPGIGLDLGEFGFGIDRHAGCGGGPPAGIVAGFAVGFVTDSFDSRNAVSCDSSELSEMSEPSESSTGSAASASLSFFGHLIQRSYRYLVLSRLIVRLSRL